MIWQCCKRTEKGDLFSKYTLMSRRTEPSLLFFSDKASLSSSCSHFRCDDCVYQTGFAVMAAALTRATCLESTKRLSRSLVESTVGSQGISLSICVQAAASADCSWCLGGNNNSLIAQSDYITARRSAQLGLWMDFGFITIFGKTLQENWWHSAWQVRLKSDWWFRLCVSVIQHINTSHWLVITMKSNQMT